MRRLIASLATAGLLAACSGGDSEDATPRTDSTAAPSTASEAPAETAADDPVADPPQPQPAGDSAFDQLVALAGDETVSDLDVALAELSTFIGPIPGVPTLIADDSVYPSLTNVMLQVDAGRAELTPEQVDVVDAGLDALFPPDQIIDGFPLFPDDAEPEGFAPHGFASSAAGPPVEDASPELRAAVVAAGEAVRGYLGGPSLNIWVQTYPLGALGDVAGRNVGLGLTDSRRESLPGNPDCIIMLASGATVGDIAGIVAHEITHCWQFTRLGFDVDRMNATGRWVIEGQAAFVGQEIGGLTRFNGNWWSHYLSASVDGNGQWRLYPGSYDAIGFWSRVAAGSEVIPAMRRALDAAPSDARMLTAATSEIGDGFNWLAAGTYQRPEWGGGWTASGPGDPGTPRRTTTHRVIERNDVALSADPGAQANHEIEVVPVGGAEGSVATARGSGAGVLRVDPADIVLGGSYVEEWCIGVCLCPDDTPAFPADRVQPGAFTIAASIVGRAADATTLGVRVGEFDAEDPDRCEEDDEEEPEPAPEPDGDIGGLVGTWRANPGAVAQAFEQASAFGDSDAAIDIAGVSGDVLLTFDEGGTGSLAYREVTMFLNDEVIGDLTLNGAGTFNWSISGPNVVIDGTDYAISVSSSALGGELLTLTDEDIPATGTTRLSGAVAGNTLTFTSADGSAGAVFFPVSWTRQS